MAIGHRAATAVVVGPGEPARVGELQTDEQVVGPAGAPQVVPRAGVDGAPPSASAWSSASIVQLVRVGPPVGADRHRLAAPDELRPGPAERSPPAARPGRWAGRRSVPSQPSIGRTANRLPTAPAPAPRSSGWASGPSGAGVTESSTSGRSMPEVGPGAVRRSAAVCSERTCGIDRRRVAGASQPALQPLEQGGQDRPSPSGRRGAAGVAWRRGDPAAEVQELARAECL